MRKIFGAVFLVVMIFGDAGGYASSAEAGEVATFRTATPGARLSSRMGKLNSRHRALRLNKGCNSLERLGMFIRPDSKIAERNPAFRRYCCRFLNEKRSAADSTSAVVNEVPIRWNAVLTAKHIHGGKKDAIPEFNVSKF